MRAPAWPPLPGARWVSSVEARTFWNVFELSRHQSSRSEIGQLSRKLLFKTKTEARKARSRRCEVPRQSPEQASLSFLWGRRLSAGWGVLMRGHHPSFRSGDKQNAASSSGALSPRRLQGASQWVGGSCAVPSRGGPFMGREQGRGCCALCRSSRLGRGPEDVLLSGSQSGSFSETGLDL